MNRMKNAKQGSVILMVTFGAVFFLGLTSLITDVGWMYYQKAKLQTAVNAGWKAGYDRMMELGYPLDDAKRADITQRVKDVMQQNGYESSQLPSIQVTFPANKTLEVNDTNTVNLFFARILNINQATVAAGRSDLNTMNAQIIPLAIPYGVTKDIDKDTYAVTLFSTSPSEVGFVASVEYVLKLGGSEPGTDPNAIARLFVPMGAGDQPNDSAYLKAYGVAHWALGQPNFVPMEWMIGYRGGAFMFPYSTDPDIEATKKYSVLKKRLTDRGINCQELTTNQANAHYDACDSYLPSGRSTNILRLSYQPIIKMVSSADPDPVGTIMRTAEIAYGPGLTGGAGANWQPYKMGLYDTYNTAKVGVYWDDGVLAGELNYGAHWLHIHHEKFGDTASTEGQVSAALVSQYGFTSKKSGSITFSANVVGKQEMVYKIRQFGESGKMIYTQCAATDNMDAALWMRRLRINAADPTPYADCLALTDFNYVTYSKGVQKTGWPVAMNKTSFEGNTKAKPSGGGYNLNNQYDPRQQNHKMTDLAYFSGNTPSFNASYVRSIDKYPSTTNPVQILARNVLDNSVRYMSGKVIGSTTYGEFAYFGGHEQADVYGKRLTLNNVLLGSLVAERLATGGGSLKYNYGIVDPNNIAGSFDEYGNFLKFGSNVMTNVSDRLLPLPGVATEATNTGIDYRVNGDLTASPPVAAYARVIVPITDVGPEIAINAALATDTAGNASATSIYDLRGRDTPGGAYATASYDFKASVRIIGYAEFEIIPLSEADPARTSIIGATQDGQIRGRFVRYIVKPYTDVIPQ